MCGIFGLVDYKNKVEENDVVSVISAMSHRGPDDNGIELFESPKYSLGLGHVRLSVIDLSSLGHQPMKYQDLTIVYNGEVYNYKELKTELEKLGHLFVSNSDTEVILQSFAEWGLKCVERFIGMFAFAIYSKKENKLYCCRDRAGVKPFFYYQDHSHFAFGSELKCILSLYDIDKTIDEEALAYYLQLGFIPMNKCILKKGKKLEAGHWLIYDIETKKINHVKYWDIDDFYRKPKLSLPYDAAKEQLKKLLISAFKYRMISDVPVGVFLSGGFDSSAVAAILIKELGFSLRTFTIGFHDGQNEAPDAEIIAKHLGTNHESYYCSTKDVLDIIPSLPFFFDEPCADISAIPTSLVSKISRKNVKVALSADGGDEVFAGYYSYEYWDKYLSKLVTIPKTLRRLIAFSCPLVDCLIPKKRTAYQWFSDTISAYFMEDKMTAKSFMFNSLAWDKSQYKEIRGFDYDCKKAFDYISTSPNGIEYALSFDYKNIMRELLCTKVDRSSMSVSLEAREPMLDHRIAEFCAQLPLNFKYENGIKKRILKDIVYDYLPKTIMDKPKKGFSIPLGNWMRNELREYVFDNMTRDSLEKTGFNSQKVINMLDNYIYKGYHYGYAFRGYSNLVWRILQYQLWYKTWIENEK